MSNLYISNTLLLPVDVGLTACCLTKSVFLRVTYEVLHLLKGFYGYM